MPAKAPSNAAVHTVAVVVPWSVVLCHVWSAEVTTGSSVTWGSDGDQSSPRRSGLVVRRLAPPASLAPGRGSTSRDTRYPVGPGFGVGARGTTLSLSHRAGLCLKGHEMSRGVPVPDGGAGLAKLNPTADERLPWRQLAGHHAQGECFWDHFVVLI